MARFRIYSMLTAARLLDGSAETTVKKTPVEMEMVMFGAGPVPRIRFTLFGVPLYLEWDNERCLFYFPFEPLRPLSKKGAELSDTVVEVIGILDRLGKTFFTACLHCDKPPLDDGRYIYQSAELVSERGSVLARADSWPDLCAAILIFLLKGDVAPVVLKGDA